MTSRDLAQEPRYRQYPREPACDQLWPVMARAVRELLYAVCDDRGPTLPDCTESVRRRRRTPPTRPEERTAATQAVERLFAEDHLVTYDGFVWVRRCCHERGIYQRWRREFVREPLQHLTWPTLARGIRDLLNRFAEQDGTIVSATDWAEALVGALGAYEAELELVREALQLLV